MCEILDVVEAEGEIIGAAKILYTKMNKTPRGNCKYYVHSS